LAEFVVAPKASGISWRDHLKFCYREQNKTNPTFGHCYIASEVLFHFLNSNTPGRYFPSIGKDENGINHWWLVDRVNGKIIDLTADQYFSQGKLPPYKHGKKCSFLTKTPSKRARIVIERIKLKLS
jgi:hypothetical protein